MDLRRTPEGTWYCLEVNPSPVFTFYRVATGQPIGQAIARLLATLLDSHTLRGRAGTQKAPSIPNQATFDPQPGRIPLSLSRSRKNLALWDSTLVLNAAFGEGDCVVRWRP